MVKPFYNYSCMGFSNQHFPRAPHRDGTARDSFSKPRRRASLTMNTCSPYIHWFTVHVVSFKKNCVGTWICAISWELEDLKLCEIILDAPIWKTPSSSHIWKNISVIPLVDTYFQYIIHCLLVFFIMKVNHCQFPWNIKLNLFKTHWLYSINAIHTIFDHENHEIPWKSMKYIVKPR